MSDNDIAVLLNLKWTRFLHAIKSFFTIKQFVKLMLCFAFLGCGIGIGVIRNYDLYDYNTIQGSALFISTMLVITILIIIIFDHGLYIAYIMLILLVLSAVYLFLPSDYQYLNNGWLREVNDFSNDTSLILCAIFASYAISFYLFVYFLIDPFYLAMKKIVLVSEYRNIKNNNLQDAIRNIGLTLPQHTINAIEQLDQPTLVIAYLRDRYCYTERSCISDLLILTESGEFVSVIPKKYIQHEYAQKSHKTKVQKLKDKIDRFKQNLNSR